MWTEYLNVVEDYDKRLTDGWKDDANSVLVFVSPHLQVQVSIPMTIGKTGLFSATVAAFIIASYPQLSPDTGTRTVFLLEQLSQQFSGFVNGTYVQPKSYPSSPPNTSIIYVNVLWILSLLVSITSALFATLMLQWARVYVELTSGPGLMNVPSDRARIRSVLFLGSVKYPIQSVMEVVSVLLHLSVFLFYIGLVVFFFTINNTVAIAILIFVGLFGLVYFILTIHPFLDHSYLYLTPMTRLSWYLGRTSLFFFALFLRPLFSSLRCCFVSYNLGDTTSFVERILTRLLDTIENTAEKHGRRLKDGFRGNLFEYARRASQDIDVEALTWMFQLPALAEKGKFQKFLASVPGKRIVQLFGQDNLFSHEKITFRHHLSALFHASCTPDTAGLTEEQAKEMRNDLLVSLNTIHHIIKGSIASRSLSPSLLNDMRSHFANTALMRPLWVDDDPAIRVTARSICALLARQLLRMPQLEARELSWLQEVMDWPSSMIFNAHRVNDLAALDDVNVDAFVNGVLSQQAEVLPNVQATLFKETLKILMNADSQAPLHADTFEEWLTSRIELEQGHQNRDNVVDNLRRMFSSTTAGPQAQAPGT